MAVGGGNKMTLAHNHKDDLEPSMWDAPWMIVYGVAIILVLILVGVA